MNDNTFYRDPFNGEQVRFFRQDPTGRYAPLHIEEEPLIDGDTWVFLISVFGGFIVTSLILLGWLV